MKLRTLFTLVALGVGSASLSSRADAFPTVLGRIDKGGGDAKDKGGADKGGGASKGGKGAGGAGKGGAAVKKQIGLSPQGVSWGMGHEDLAKVYDKVFDTEFADLYKKVEPGPRMAELDGELTRLKGEVRRNWFEFAATPSGLDNGPLKSEYTYNNSESFTWVTLRSGVKRYFFFFNDRLWKIYEEHKYGKKNNLGDSYQDGVGKVGKMLGSKGKAAKAGASPTVPFDSMSWSDGKTILRLLDRDEKIQVVSYLDESVESSLDKLRSNKPKEEGLSAETSGALLDSAKPPEPPKGKGKGKKK